MDTIELNNDSQFDEEVEFRMLASGTWVMLVDGLVIGKVNWTNPCSHCDGYGHDVEYCPAYWGTQRV